MSRVLIKHPGLSRSLPFALFILVLAVELNWTTLQPLNHGLQSVDKRWLYGIKAGLAALALIWLWARFEELKTLPRQPGGWVMAVSIGVGIFVLWINLTQSWLLLGDMGRGFDPRHAGGQMDWPLAGIRLAGSALVVPIMEELFWRSFIMRWIDNPDFLLLDPRNVSHRSLLISSALFALEHTQWFAGFLAGFAYGWLYRKTGKLWLSIFAHAITNAMLGLWVLKTGNWQFW